MGEEGRGGEGEGAGLWQQGSLKREDGNEKYRLLPNFKPIWPPDPHPLAGFERAATFIFLACPSQNSTISREPSLSVKNKTAKQLGEK